jgi:hypothetical protein
MLHFVASTAPANTCPSYAVNLTEQDGSLMSPFYSSNGYYYNLARCQWRLIAPTSDKVSKNAFECSVNSFQIWFLNLGTGKIYMFAMHVRRTSLMLTSLIFINATGSKHACH